MAPLVSAVFKHCTSIEIVFHCRTYVIPIKENNQNEPKTSGPKIRRFWYKASDYLSSRQNEESVVYSHKL